MCEIEEGLATHGYWINTFCQQLKILQSERDFPLYSVRLERVLHSLPEMVETRFRIWGWDFALTPDGLHDLTQRLQAHRENTYIPLLDAALSWRLGRDVERHAGADELANVARKLGIRPTMTAEQGREVIWDRHRTWYMTPALAVAIPEVPPEEHARFSGAVDELEREFRCLEPPESLRESAQTLDEWPARNRPQAHPEPSRPAGVDESANRSEPKLSDDQRCLLVAALSLAAMDSDSRKTTEELVKEAMGGFADPANAKKALSRLVKAGLLESQQGRGGGYWLTKTGRIRAERLK
jgi:hypothetical protein